MTFQYGLKPNHQQGTGLKTDNSHHRDSSVEGSFKNS